MNISTPLQVELVNNSNVLTDYVLPIAAIVISLGTLIWTIWLNQRNKAKIAVSLQFAMLLQDGTPPMFSITATQVGESGRERVTGIGLYSTTTKMQLFRPSSFLTFNTPLPLSLEAGDEAVAFYEIDGIADSCWKNGIDPNHLRPFAKTTRGMRLGRMPKDAIGDIERRIEKMSTDSAVS